MSGVAVHLAHLTSDRIGSINLLFEPPASTARLHPAVFEAICEEEVDIADSKLEDSS